MCGDYVRQVFSFVPGSLAAISLVIVLVFQTSHKGEIEFVLVWPIYVCVDEAAVSTKVFYSKNHNWGQNLELTLKE